MVLYAAAVQDAFAELPAVKSETKVLWSRPVSLGQVALVGLQEVKVCAVAMGSEAANAAAVDLEKRMLNYFSCDSQAVVVLERYKGADELFEM